MKQVMPALEFQARILDAATGRVLHAPAPVSVRRAEASAGLQQLAQTTAGAIAIHFDEMFGGLHAVSYPPTLDGYREYRAGMEVFQSDYPRALEHFKRALEIDPKFLLPWGAMAAVHGNLREDEEQEAVLARMEADLDRFTPAERLLVEYWRSNAEGQWAHALRLLEELEWLVPQSLTIPYSIMRISLNLNHPAAAVAANDRMLSDRRSYRHGIGTFRPLILTEALHLLGEHERELDEARLAQRYAPGVLGLVAAEARALVALNDLNGMDGVIARALGTPAMVGSAGYVMKQTARELRAHGHRQASLALADRAVAWYRGRASEATSSAAQQYELARALYLTERWEEAEAAFSALALETPEDYRVQATLA